MPPKFMSAVPDSLISPYTQQHFEQFLVREGAVITGTVVAIEKDLAVIDVGLKTEGRVPLREFNGPGRQNDIKVGDTVDVYLERVENALGEAVLSRDKARREESWGKLEKAFQGNEKVQGVIFNQVKGGFTVDLDGAVAFLPRSQVDIRPIRDVTPLMNVSQPFQILKMDRRRGNIVVSRRTVLEETLAEQRQELVQNLEEGQVIDGVVKNITDYGAFVDLGGIDGLLHVTDIAWRRVNHPSEVLNVGQQVKVKIVKINHETHRISLGIKQLQADPWQDIEVKFPVNARLTGRVTNITDYGAFVELEPGMEGLIHVSEMSWTKKNVHHSKIVSTSQEVEVQVLEVDPVKRRILLGLKQTMTKSGEVVEEKEAIQQHGSAHSDTVLRRQEEQVSSAAKDHRLYAPPPQLVDLLYEGLLANYEIVRARAGKFQEEVPLPSKERSEAILASRILEVIASRARRIALGVVSAKPLVANDKFDYEVVIEMCTNIPIRLDDATTFFKLLREDLISWLQSGGSIDGSWGKLVLKDQAINIEVESPGPKQFVKWEKPSSVEWR